jgi:HEAT repeat protein
MTDQFRRAMQMMRRHDPQTMEDGFALLQPCAAEHIEELIAQFRQEPEDGRLRYWLLELIGDARSPAALPLLAEMIGDKHESIRRSAARGLEQLGSKEARTVLWRARVNSQIE